MMTVIFGPWGPGRRIHKTHDASKGISGDERGAMTWKKEIPINSAPPDEKEKEGKKKANAILRTKGKTEGKDTSSPRRAKRFCTSAKKTSSRGSITCPHTATAQEHISKVRPSLPLNPGGDRTPCQTQVIPKRGEQGSARRLRMAEPCLGREMVGGNPGRGPDRPLGIERKRKERENAARGTSEDRGTFRDSALVAVLQEGSEKNREKKTVFSRRRLCKDRGGKGLRKLMVPDQLTKKRTKPSIYQRPIGQNHEEKV